MIGLSRRQCNYTFRSRRTGRLATADITNWCSPPAIVCAGAFVCWLLLPAPPLWAVQPTGQSEDATSASVPAVGVKEVDFVLSDTDAEIAADPDAHALDIETDRRARRGGKLQAARVATRSANGVLTVVASGSPGVEMRVQVSVPGSIPLIQIESSSGNITVSDASAAVHATSGNGDITLENIAGAMQVRSASGAVHCVPAENFAQPLNIRTDTGDIELELPAHINGRLRIRTGGQIASDTALKIENEHTLDLHLGSGRERLEIVSKSGDVRLAPRDEAAK
jgi:hypothetical protein